MYKKLILFLISLIFMSCTPQKEVAKMDVVSSQLDKYIVQTTYGKVRGYQHDKSYIFKGIPYAKAERFMPPVEPDSWKGVRSTLAFGPISPQHIGLARDEYEFLFQHKVGYMSEDCMRLNVWTPGINDGKKRPVMVWFHGGGFSGGYGHVLPAFDGENINKKGDVLLVTVNHRLNVLGFLNLSDFGNKYKYSGNVGAMDLIAALKWINQNIEAFGGDPENITIFGQSGGGGKVTSIMVAPSAQGLFHKAIIQSGTRPYFLEGNQSKMIGQRIMKELGLQPSDVDELQKIPYKTLIDVGDKVIDNLNEELSNADTPLYNSRLGWGPYVDGDFIAYQPISEEALALSRDISIIMGTNKNESIPFRANVDISMPPTMEEVKGLLKEKFGDRTDEYIEIVKKTYPDNISPMDFLNIETDYRSRTIMFAKHRAKVNPIYMYFFQWNSPALDGKYQSPHGLELPFVFSNVDRMPELVGGGKDALVLNNMIGQAWINFAKSGDPNHEGLPTWPVYSEENSSLMVFDNECKVRSHHDKELLDYMTKY
ncbi:MAG: hypothetical protein B7Z06_05535 [Flavobacteriales bacterium 32-35-8]|nr:MAG: hypothetical protein B7Z06_05535 [Flavobacteriales bacterium 32-35-8]